MKERRKQPHLRLVQFSKTAEENIAKAEGQLSITCPRCGRKSWNENDVREGYCGNCHDYTGEKA